VRYLGLAEAFIIAEAVTGIDAHDLVHVSRGDLLDSALHAPQAGFGETDFYLSLVEKAAVLCVRIAKNHPLPDGNKRLAWMAMVVFLELNDSGLEVDEDDAVDAMLAVAAGQTDEAALTEWLRHRVLLTPNSE
jgi:death-on-curing protein